MRWIRLAPVTTESLMICVAIFVGCSLQAALNHERYEDVQREWGAIRSLELVEYHDGVRRSNGSELNGPFDVWNGEWWRVPVTVFHHANLLHLVLNLGAIGYLGLRLERRWGSFRMMLFLVPSTCIPVMAELCGGHAVIGFSGVACAMLGALVVLRRFDPQVAEEFSSEAADLGMAAILLCWLATIFEIEAFANIAHLTGFLYGALMATVTSGSSISAVLVRVGVALAHLALVPGLFEVSHPSWIGRYYWYQAVSSRTGTQREASLEKAIHRDPALSGVWLRWSQAAESRGDLLEAWRRLIQGLVINPSSAPLIDSTRRLWRHLDSGSRQEAEMILAQYFGRRSILWLNQIRAEVPTENQNSNENVIKLEKTIDPHEFSLDRKLELPLLQEFPVQPNLRDPKRLDLGNDAVEGRTL